MQETVDFLIRHGYSVVFITVFAQQLGIPVPSPPLLLAAGALAGTGQMDFWLLAGLTLVASSLGDFIWYEIGRRRGGKVLRLLCRIALEPDLCVRKTEDTFLRHGARSLLYAKFVPGLSTMAPPLAGIIGMRPGRFLLLTTLGAVIYFGLFLVLGFIFSDQLERVAAHAADLGDWV